MSSHFTLVNGYIRQGPDKLGDNGCTFAIPVAEKWKDKDGELQEHTEWYNVVVNGRTADAVLNNLEKGAYVSVQGKMRTRKVGDKVYHNLIGQLVDFGPRPSQDDADNGAPF